ncbi:formylglycine-generating enzyme family protein [Nitrospina gracilis]|uniref:formylglycine-generating enzyme family protein n=1 Tax=Nitrospina gracilis TaxID=35801 RepID=UPI001F45C405|nr:formylglycine-generating enzyme family protein [Nitrospina gracilis]MCF8720124.1 formylglycine-generating enzyme required for sulfatase activity [Nitrospina gracilis Nb-211]
MLPQNFLRIATGVAFAAVFFTAEASLAFESLKNHTTGMATCQTACHQPENLVRAKLDKFNKAECRACHVGPGAVAKQNPFTTRSLHIQPEDAVPNRRVRSLRGPVLAGKATGTAGNKTSSSVKSIPGMVYIPAGEFIMGSNDRWDDESPEHIALTEAFYIDLYEVTNEKYREFVKATGHEAPFHWPDGNLPKGKEKHPVTYVNWHDADAYCKWKGKRLPTEQEWEKAARGEDGNIYPWGNVWVLTKSNNPYKGSTGTEPVGSYPDGRSPYGLFDMSGNVWEWVDSYYLPHPGNPIPKAEYGREKRILKGGSWFDCLSYGCGLSAPTFNRAFFNPEVRNNSFGFRCALSAKPEKAAQSQSP